MGKHLPLGVVAVAFVALAISVFYLVAAAQHLRTLWLVPVSLAFTTVGLLSIAVAIKLREYGLRLAALERVLED